MFDNLVESIGHALEALIELDAQEALLEGAEVAEAEARAAVPSGARIVSLDSYRTGQYGWAVDVTYELPAPPAPSPRQPPKRPPGGGGVGWAP